MVKASIPGVAAISSSLSNARFVSSMIVTCTRAFAWAVCSASGRERYSVFGPKPYIPRSPSGA
jgi:hypothetical protein